MWCPTAWRRRRSCCSCPRTSPPASSSPTIRCRACALPPMASRSAGAASRPLLCIRFSNLGVNMIKHALFVRLEAKPGKEKELAQFLQAGLGMAQDELTTPVWFALLLGPSTFGIFDAFLDEQGRQA